MLFDALFISRVDFSVHIASLLHSCCSQKFFFRMAGLSLLLTRLDALGTLAASLSEAAKPDFLSKQYDIMLHDLKLLVLTVDEATTLVDKIKGIALWQPEQVDCFVAAISGRMVATSLARKQTQDYTNMCHYLTGPLWNMLNSEEDVSVKLHTLMKHLLKLGLRYPSEPTYATICVLVHPKIEEDAPHERFRKLSDVKPFVKRACDSSAEPRAVYTDTFPDDPQRFLARFPLQDCELAKCPFDVSIFIGAVKSIPLRSSNRQSQSLSSMVSNASVPSAPVDLMGLMSGMMAHFMQQGSTNARIQMIQPRQTLLQKALSDTTALLDQSTPSASQALPSSSPQLQAIEDIKPAAVATDQSSNKDPLEVVAKLKAMKQGCRKRPAAAAKATNKEVKTAKKVQKDKKEKKASPAKASSGALPLPTKTQALKLRPNGCGRCRRTSGCFPGCWLRRKPYKK